MRQRQALAVMLAGESVFLTGPPGAGKTYVLNEFIQLALARGRRIAVTASTGIAATHIGGTTIHSWSGLGIKDELSAHDAKVLAATDRLVKRYNTTDVLVIDEVSMLHGKRLDMVNQACKLLRQNDAPFGGLQVILVGDLFQLPPVNRDSDVFDFAHLSDAWKELNPKICYLSEQHRQTGDGLLDVLVAMRQNAISDGDRYMLRERLGKRPDEDQLITRLYAHNVDVETINDRKLLALRGEAHTYDMSTRGSNGKVEQLLRGMLAPQTLELKKGAEVMFVANDFARGFVNGSRGRVIGFRGDDDAPKVELAHGGRIVTVEPHTWSLVEDGKVKAEVTQLPLRLAWAITIHKSQGMSLDAAEIDLSKSFTPGMGYVALSRVRSLDGLYLAGVNRMAMQLHPDIFAFDAELLTASQALAATVEDFDSDPDITSEKSVVEGPQPDTNLVQALKAWRRKRAEQEGMPPYIVAHDTALIELAIYKPRSTQALRGVKGFGPKKVEKYGEEIIQVINQHAPVSAEELAAEQVKVEAEARTTEIAEQPEPAQQYARAGKRWSDEEDAELLRLFRDRRGLTKVSEELERTPTSIWTRLQMILVDKESKI